MSLTKKEGLERRSKRLKMIKSYIINNATESEMIDLTELMRLRKTSLDLKKES